jgi:hypothetical protein
MVVQSQRPHVTLCEACAMKTFRFCLPWGRVKDSTWMNHWVKIPSGVRMWFWWGEFLWATGLYQLPTPKEWQMITSSWRGNLGGMLQHPLHPLGTVHFHFWQTISLETSSFKILCISFPRSLQEIVLELQLILVFFSFYHFDFLCVVFFGFHRWWVAESSQDEILCLAPQAHFTITSKNFCSLVLACGVLGHLVQ